MKVKCDVKGIREAADAVSGGKVIVFPTDTVYGMGCDPFNADAVRKIFSTKRRDLAKPLPVLGYSKDDLAKIAHFTKNHEKIISRFWPGPLTIVTSLADDRLKESLNLQDKIAVRIPKNECALSILKECKVLVGTSANISGEDSFVDPEKCGTLEGVSVFVDGGVLDGGGESTIMELDGDDVRILRDGQISKEELVREL